MTQPAPKKDTKKKDQKQEEDLVCFLLFRVWRIKS
jgi:hypothetical protein